MRVTDELGIFRNRVYLLDVPDDSAEDGAEVESHQTLDQLVDQGAQLAALDPPQETGKQIAFLAATSGTSGMQVSFPQHNLKLV